MPSGAVRAAFGVCVLALNSGRCFSCYIVDTTAIEGKGESGEEREKRGWENLFCCGLNRGAHPSRGREMGGDVKKGKGRKGRGTKGGA